MNSLSSCFPGRNYGTELESLLRRHDNCTHPLYCRNLIYEFSVITAPKRITQNTVVGDVVFVFVLVPLSLSLSLSLSHTHTQTETQTQTQTQSVCVCVGEQQNLSPPTSLLSHNKIALSLSGFDHQTVEGVPRVASLAFVYSSLQRKTRWYFFLWPSP